MSINRERRREYQMWYRKRNREELRERTREIMQQRRTRNRTRLFKAAVYGSENFFCPEKFQLGALSVECSHCNALFFKNENKSNCCHNGKLSHLPTIGNNFPLDLKNLFSGADNTCKNFRQFIRQYNNANAFASMGAKIHDIPGSVYCFKISGEIYHRSANNIPIDLSLNSENYQDCSRNLAYAELFLYDPDIAVNIRMNNPANIFCNRQIMEIISNVLRNNSPYAVSYKKLREVYQKELTEANLNDRPLNNVSLVFTRNLHDDQRVYNAPTNVDDIALIFVSDREGNFPANLDFAVHPTGSRTIQRINQLSKHLDPMIFPLLFPNGQFGWTTNIFHNSENATAVRKNVTTLQFYSHKIAVRKNIFNPLHFAGKLFQQYLVYAYARVEANRLNFIRSNQQSLRVETYKGLLDYVNNLCQNSNTTVGNIYILPSSFTGGPRFMAKLYQDNISIVRKFGRPDLFITFTSNPSWKEIKSDLRPFQNASDRPDIVTRVFNLKLKEFLDDIVKQKIFGSVVSYVYTIEHQKRGLPHAHCLFTLNNEDKFRTSEEIDKIISAEIPDINENLSLYEIITKHNIHGPCGELNKNSVCMIDGKCSKQFPKSFCDETDISTNNYPRYKRRPPNNPDNLTRTRSNIIIDNRFVVPYNPFLSLKYDAHINVELCSTVKAIKYIHKYITKGHDYARIGISADSNNNENSAIEYDEIRQYLNCRYLSSQEAAWHLQELPIHGQSHNVVTLSLHLEGGQSIFFTEDNMENSLRREAARCTTLTAFFKLNCTDNDAHNFLYQDIPTHYIFKNNKWQKRSENSHFGQKCIGRIVSVSPRDSELYHLRLLLLKFKGSEVTSFNSLKVFNNVTYPTYKEVARARGIINDSLEWHNCLLEASSYVLPKSLRSLFATILCYCNPNNSVQLFNDFKNNLMEDFLNQQMPEDQAEAQCIFHLNKQCEQIGFDFLSALPLPNIAQILNNSITVVLDPVIPVIEPTLWELLNSDQFSAASTIFSSIQCTMQHKYFYLDGPGGSGKTFLYRALIQKLDENNKKILCLAWTGIAATLLPNGITCHSAFSLPLNMNTVKFPKLTRTKRDFLTAVDCVIWDEAPMASGIALEIVDLVFRDLMKNDLPFGGKLIVLGGDFRQVLPVVKGGNRASVINSTIKKSHLWEHFRVLSLRQNMRAVNDPQFSQWLLDIGDGKGCDNSHIKKTQYSIFIQSNYISNDLITDIFGSTFTSNDFASISQRAILCSTNEHVREINENVLKKLVSEEVVYNAIDSVKNDDGFEDENLQIQFPVEYLNSINPSGLPPYCLKLKKGCIIMLLRNLAIKQGLCNGTRLVLIDFTANCLKAQIITGSHSGTIHFIPRISLDTANDPSLPFNFSRHQFPIRLSYAMTINKSQGQTFERIGLYLPEACFTHGQLYTAFSRAITASSLKIKILENVRQGKLADGNFVTDNVVYKEIFP